jgi:glycosyltransferase involved in cell wall biosynthesis
MKILFYYPSNKRTIALETLLIELRKKNHEIIILTTCQKGDFHFYMESVGFKTYSNELKSQGIKYYLRQFLFLINFCKEQNIDLIHSHLQHTNIIAVLSQYFIKSKVIVFRHHFRFIDHIEEKISINKNEILFDKIINFLAKVIVVPSKGVYEGIKKHENVKIEKVNIIPYIYDFSKYQEPNTIEIQNIKQQYPCRLRLIMVSRLIKLKRHYIVFPIIKELIQSGYDIKLIVLDEGPEKENLEKYISDYDLKDQIIMHGFRRDFVNFMAAADLLIQPSLTDASNSAAKEFALLEKTVVVSENVGDYNEYVINNISGYLIPLKDSEKHLKEIIIDAYNNPDKINSMGKILKKEVLLKFDISNANEIIKMYEKLH